MEKSKTYARLKERGLRLNKPFVVNITPLLAQELLSRRELEREMMLEYVWFCAFMFRAGLFDEHDVKVVQINTSNDKLVSGSHELRGLLWSGLKSTKMLVCFVDYDNVFATIDIGALRKTFPAGFPLQVIPKPIP